MTIAIAAICVLVGGALIRIVEDTCNTLEMRDE